MDNRKYDEPMEFFKIDKISDDVYAIGPNIILKFNVSLSKVSNGKRYHFHKEYEYPSKIPEMPTVATIKRSFDYYLSIESMQKDNNGNKIFIRIGVQEYMIFKKGIEEAVSWFTDSKYAYLFARKAGKLVLISPIPDFKITNLPMQKSVMFTPIIIDKGMANDDKEPGIRMYLGDDSSFVDMNLDRLMGLYYIFSCFNMYQSAAIMINYLERPEFGTNRFVLENQQSSFYNRINEPREGADCINGRLVTPKGTKNNISLLE